MYYTYIYIYTVIYNHICVYTYIFIYTRYQMNNDNTPKQQLRTKQQHTRNKTATHVADCPAWNGVN